MRTRLRAGEEQGAAPPDETDIPDFDALDMLVGFGIAASAAAEQYALAVLLVAGFVAQKAARSSPKAHEKLTSLRGRLARGAAGRLLPAPAKRLMAVGDKATSGVTPLLGAPATLQAGAAGDDALLRELEAAPHLLVIGHTRGGKTTLMHELAQRRARRGERVLVCDPDAAPGVWPQCRVVGGGDDFDQIAQALALTEQEVQRRREARAGGQRRFPPLHVVIDEVQDTITLVPESLALIETIARRGAKLNMHLVLGVQDKQVKTLGLEGKGDLRNNFLVVDVLRDRATGQRLARLESAGERQTLPVPTLPDPETLIVAPQGTAAEAVGATAEVREAPDPAAAAPTTQGLATPAPPAPPVGLEETRIQEVLAAQGAARDELLLTLLTQPAAEPPSGRMLHPQLADARLLNAPIEENAQRDALNASPERSETNVQEPGTAARSSHQDARSGRDDGVVPRSAPAGSADDVGQAMLRLLEVITRAGGDPSRLGQLLARLRALEPSYDELLRLTGALVLRSEGKTKQQALEAAFACSKGAGAAWRRAIALYDTVLAT